MAEKLTELELALKKVALAGKKYSEDLVDASKLKKYEKGTPNTGYLKTIILSTADTLAGATSDANRIEIDIPKEFFLRSKKLLTIEAGTGADEGKFMVVKEDNVAVQSPYEADEQVDAAGTWLDLVVNTEDNSETAKHTLIDLTSFIDVYTNGDGIALNNKVFSIKLKMSGNDNVSGLAFDGNGNLYLNIDSSNANGLAITAAGLKLALATPSTDGVGGSAGAMSAADKEKLDKALTEDDYAHLSDAEIASWYGYDSTAAATILGSVSDDAVEEESGSGD